MFGYVDYLGAHNVDSTIVETTKLVSIVTYIFVDHMFYRDGLKEMVRDRWCDLPRIVLH